MNEIVAIPGEDFGSFRLNYTITASANFPSLEFIDENYLASLFFKAPGASVSIVLTVDQLRHWFECLELSTADGGVNMQTLPIMRASEEYGRMQVRTYNNKLYFDSGTMDTTINFASCLNAFTNCIKEIYRELDELEEAW